MKQISYILSLLCIPVSILFFWYGFGDGFEFPKITLTLSLLLGSTIFLMLDGAYIDELRSIPRRIRMFLPLLIGIEVLATLASVDPISSFLGAFARYQGSLLHIVLLLSIPTWMYHVRTHRDQVVHTFIISTAIMMGIGCITALFSTNMLAPVLYQDRVYATLGNPNVAAIVVLTAILFALRETSSKPREYAMIICGLMFILLTGSRTVLLLALGSLLLLLYGSHKKLLISLLVGSVLMIGLFLPRFVDILDGSFGGRMELWKHTIAYMPELPLFGLGPDMQEVAFEHASFPTITHGDPTIYIDRAHNVLLDMLLGIGIIGTVLYGIAILRILKSTYTSKETYTYVTIVVLLGYLSLHIITITIQLLLLICISTLLTRQSCSRKTNMLH